MTSVEWLAAGYFAALTAAAAARRAPARALLLAAGSATLVIVARLTLSEEVRLWLPHLYLMLGYWIPAALVRERNEAFERWLLGTERWFRGTELGLLGSGTFSKSQIPDPRSQMKSQIGFGIWDLGFGILEISYLLCYPLVPAAFLTVLLLGTVEDVERFWLAVLVAGYACYVSLPWAAARPPSREGKSRSRGLAGVNAFVLRLVSHRLVTFPSGHVAVAVAAALAAGGVSAGAGLAFGVVALLVAVAAVAGRYHYAVDSLLGLAVGGLAWLITGRGA